MLFHSVTQNATKPEEISKVKLLCSAAGKRFLFLLEELNVVPSAWHSLKNIIIKGFQLQQIFKCSEIFSFFRCVNAIETKSFYKEGFLFWYAAQVTLNAKRLWALQLPWKRRVSARISKSKNYLRLRTKRQIPSTFVRPTLTPLRHAFYRVLQIFQCGCFWSFYLQALIGNAFICTVAYQYGVQIIIQILKHMLS